MATPLHFACELVQLRRRPLPLGVPGRSRGGKFLLRRGAPDSWYVRTRGTAPDKSRAISQDTARAPRPSIARSDEEDRF